jgi:5,10-methylenetetrahydrofolate reductase
VPILYEVTPPSKFETRNELEEAVVAAISAGAVGIDITESPTGESHSCSLAAGVYAKLVHRIEVTVHLRTRDLTANSLFSAIRACEVWQVDSVLLVMGDGGPSTGLYPTRALKLIREEGLGRGIKIGVIFGGGQEADRRKLEARPDFVYTPIMTNMDEIERAHGVAEKHGVELFASVFVHSEKNKAIAERIRLPQAALDDRLVRSALALADRLVVISPADLEGGTQFVRSVAAYERNSGTRPT